MEEQNARGKVSSVGVESTGKERNLTRTIENGFERNVLKNKCRLGSPLESEALTDDDRPTACRSSYSRTFQLLQSKLV